VEQLIVELNPVHRGWENYFRTGNADREFHSMDHFVVQRLRRWQYRCGARRPPFTHEQLYAMALIVYGHGAIPYTSHTQKIIV